MSSSPVALRIMEIIESDADADMSLAQIAKKVGISVWYMSHIFKKETGKTVVEYRTYCRMKKASELLISTDKSITEIALTCGFSTQGYFSERFTKIFGMSPTKYRAENANHK